MGRLAFTRNDLAAYDLLSRAGSDIKSGMMQYRLSKAADVKPETITNTSLTDTTPNQEGMVIGETREYLPKYLENGKPTEQTQAQLNTPAEGTSKAPEGIQPTFSTKTTTRYKMGDKVQDQPFTQEQIDAQVSRNQAGVLTQFGLSERAATLRGLANKSEEDHRSNTVRKSFTNGLTKYADLKPLDRQWKALSMAANTAFEQGDFATWQKLAESGAGIQSRLMANAMDRADLLTDPKARLTAAVDAHNRYTLNDKMGHAISENPDGTLNVLNEDGSVLVGNIWPGQEDPKNPKSARSVNQVIAFLRSPEKVRELQQRAAEEQMKRLHGREDKAWEWGNKPIELNKGSRLVIPGKEGTGSAGPRGPIDPLEHQSMLDDIRNYALMNFGEKDPVTGKPVAQNEKSRQVAADMESLYATGGHALPPTTLLSIATNGKRSSHSVLINGQPKRIEGFAYNGVLYPVEPGIGPVPMKSPADAASADVPASVKRRFSGLQSPDTFSKTRENMGAGAPVLKRTTSGTGQSTGGTISGIQRIEPTAYNAPELDQIVVSAAQESGIPPKLLLAIKNAGEKSNNDQVSKKGAAGVMQFMPDTAKAYGVDSTNPESAIKGAGRYLADLIKQYRGNVAAAVAHYNGGSTQGALVASGKPPTYPETRAYLERVLAASEAPA